MIVSLHVTSGAALGLAAGSRGRALALGALGHFLGDLVPHRDVRSVTFEKLSGGALLLALAVRHGPTSPVVVGAAAASSPDLEHVLPLPRPGGRKLFPSHRFGGLHRAGGLTTAVQLVAAGVLAGAVLGARPRG